MLERYEWSRRLQETLQRNIYDYVQHTWRLSDLYSDNVDKSGSDYVAIVRWVREKCEQRNCISWLDNATANISRRP
ncbi:hypothetical protein KSD_18790 [Ktedonobacter sp. SOSP1-85]|nr:hypothetical protein KSD_18790 [Ktedonobacter sp. SOSP1-85]